MDPALQALRRQGPSVELAAAEQRFGQNYFGTLDACLKRGNLDLLTTIQRSFPAYLQDRARSYLRDIDPLLGPLLQTNDDYILQTQFFLLQALGFAQIIARVKTGEHPHHEFVEMAIHGRPLLNQPDLLRRGLFHELGYQGQIVEALDYARAHPIRSIITYDFRELLAQAVKHGKIDEAFGIKEEHDIDMYACFVRKDPVHRLLDGPAELSNAGHYHGVLDLLLENKGTETALHLVKTRMQADLRLEAYYYIACAALRQGQQRAAITILDTHILSDPGWESQFYNEDLFTPFAYREALDTHSAGALRFVEDRVGPNADLDELKLALIAGLSRAGRMDDTHELLRRLSAPSAIVRGNLEVINSLLGGDYRVAQYGHAFLSIYGS